MRPGSPGRWYSDASPAHVPASVAVWMSVRVQPRATPITGERASGGRAAVGGMLGS